MGRFCIVFVRIDELCGGMAAYPRTQTTEIHIPEPSTSGAWLRSLQESEIGGASRVVLAPLDLGDVVILGDLTIHESMANNSERIRLSCDYRFFGEQSHSSKHYFDISADTVVEPAVAAR